MFLSIFLSFHLFFIRIDSKHFTSFNATANFVECESIDQNGQF